MGRGGRGLIALATPPLPPLLPREFFGRPATEVAPELLGCVLSQATPDGTVAVRLTEVEAYMGSADPASHAYRGRTPRNGVMFGPPGYAYVYFTYGMHFCVNLVCHLPGDASAVLLRAGEIVAGTELGGARRGAARRGGVARDSADRDSADRELARGPARLCQALGINRALDGAVACDPASPLRVMAALGVSNTLGASNSGASDDGADISGAGSDVVRTGPRVGVREAAEVPWRFWLEDEPTVSVYRPWASRKRSRQRV